MKTASTISTPPTAIWGGRSETALRECLVARHPRSSYILTNKLSTHFFRKEEEILPLFRQQLEACGVDYFDFYLMHAQDGSIFAKYKQCHAYEIALKLKEEGKIRHFGISFHDKAHVLDQILTEYPQIEVVQIPFNYVDYEDASVESRKVYEVCEKHGKPVIVMEPVKGGSLVNLPEAAQQALDAVGNGMSNASYAIRFAAGFPNMCMVLSGMSNREQMKDNVSFMKDFQPLNEQERAAVDRVCEIFHSMNMIPCTGCHYCVLDNDCPKKSRFPSSSPATTRRPSSRAGTRIITTAISSPGTTARHPTAWSAANARKSAPITCPSERF